jgi:hypothetical protein
MFQLKVTVKKKKKITSFLAPDVFLVDPQEPSLGHIPAQHSRGMEILFGQA